MAPRQVTSGLALGLAGSAMVGVSAFVAPLRPVSLEPGLSALPAGVHLRGLQAAPASAPQPALPSLGLGLLAGLVMASAARRGSGTAMAATSSKLAGDAAAVFDDEELVAEVEPRAKASKETQPPKPLFDPAQEAGLSPFGYFDPLGFCPKGKRATFRSYRGMEIKHGRVAMMASIGLVMQHFIHRPVAGLTVHFGQSSPNGIGALSLFFGTYGFLEVALIMGLIAFVEILLWPEGGQERKDPGDFGNPLNVPLDSREMRDKELNNGRAAMISVFGIWMAELATGKDAVQQLGF